MQWPISGKLPSGRREQKARGGKLKAESSGLRGAYGTPVEGIHSPRLFIGTVYIFARVFSRFQVSVFCSMVMR
jgi:hypothetical protein